MEIIGELIQGFMIFWPLFVPIFVGAFLLK